MTLSRGTSRSASSRRAGHPIGRHDDGTATCHRFRHHQQNDVGWTSEAPCLLRRRPPSLGTSVCTCSTPTPSKAESADWRRRRKRPTRPARAGEGWDRVHYVPARPRPLGEHRDESHGFRFARTFRTSRIATELHGQEAHIRSFPGRHRVLPRVSDTF